MSTKKGQAAEKFVAEYLEKIGFEIVKLNWKTKWCEIDIVAKRNGRMHFVEVKYRKSSWFGDPLEYITADKQWQLKKAAQAWVQENDWEDDYTIDVVGVVGQLKVENIDLVIDAVG